MEIRICFPKSAFSALWGGIEKNLFFFGFRPKGGGGLAESKISLAEKTEIFWIILAKGGGLTLWASKLTGGAGGSRSFGETPKKNLFFFMPPLITFDSSHANYFETCNQVSERESLFSFEGKCVSSKINRKAFYASSPTVSVLTKNKKSTFHRID